MTTVYRVIPWLLLVLLPACGFQLRGQVDLPAGLEPVYVGGAYSNLGLGIELRRRLSAAGVDVTANIAQAKMLLLINKQETDWRTLAVGDGMLAAEYQLFESVVYEFRKPTGEIIFGPNKLVEQRVLPNNPDQVISTGEEEHLLREEMQQRLAAKIALQLQSLSASQLNPSTSTANSSDNETAP